ncbi:hypothetical protein D9M69_677690 [compost metagenome]
MTGIYQPTAGTTVDFGVLIISWRNHGPGHRNGLKSGSGNGQQQLGQMNTATCAAEELLDPPRKARTNALAD